MAGKKVLVRDLYGLQVGVEVLQGTFNYEFLHCNTNSKTIKKGETFFAIGKGNDFVKDALEKGATGCVVEKDVYYDILEAYPEATIVKVEDALKTLQNLAAYKRAIYHIPVVAITGSVGKTSTKDIVASVMSKKYNVLKTEGNFNNHIGLPITIMKLQEHDALVLEMGMNHLHEIEVLTDIARPNIAIITNVGTSHIGILGSRENILKAKLEILEGLQGDTVIINNDNDLLSKWAKTEKEYNIITYGIKNQNSNYVAKNIKSFEDKSTFELNNEEITVPVGGEHFVYNSLCAIAVGKYFEIPIETIKKGIETFELTKSRMEIIQLKNAATVINDCYNANFDSMKAAIKYIENIKDKRKITVLGDMLELGSYSKEIHTNLGKEIKNVDILITVGNEAKNIAKYAEAKEIIELQNNEEVVNKLKPIISPNDIILFKASHSMNFDEIINKIKEM